MSTKKELEAVIQKQEGNVKFLTGRITYLEKKCEKADTRLADERAHSYMWAKSYDNVLAADYALREKLDSQNTLIDTMDRSYVEICATNAELHKQLDAMHRRAQKAEGEAIACPRRFEGTLRDMARRLWHAEQKSYYWHGRWREDFQKNTAYRCFRWLKGLFS